MGVVVHEGAFVDERIELGPRVLVDALVEVALVLVFYRSERFEKRQERDAKEIQKRHEKRHEKRYKRGKRMSKRSISRRGKHAAYVSAATGL
jgi:hypothetical protein